VRKLLKNQKEKRMKKRAALIAGMLMVSLLAVGCGSKEPAQENVTTKAVTADDTAATAESNGNATEVIFWSSMSSNMGETLDTIVGDYNKSQDAVHVTVEFQGNYYDMAAKLQTAVTSGGSPHIAQLEMGRTKMFADYGVLQDMTGYAEAAGLDKNIFYDGLMDCCDWGDGLYALPFNRSTPMFYYNKNMFEEVGLDPLDPPETWDELKAYAEKLSIPDERWGYEMPIDAWFYEAFVMQSDGRILNEDETDIGFNNDAGIQPLYLWKNMINDGIMKAPPGKEYNSYEAARSDFAAGITGMIVCSSGDLGTLKGTCDFEIGTCFLPKNTRFGVPTGGANVVMMAGHDKDAAATMDFLTYLTSPAVAAFWSTKTGYIPSSKAASETDIYQAFVNENDNAKTALAQLEYTDIPRPINKDYPQIHAEIIMTEIQRCIEEPDYTPEAAVQAMSDLTKALLGS